jgi:hypothetical protein
MVKRRPRLDEFEIADTYDMDCEWVPEKSINELLEKYGVQIWFINAAQDQFVTPVIAPVGFKKPTNNQVIRKEEKENGWEL